MKKLVLTMLCVCLLLTLCACGSEKSIVGTWSAEASILGADNDAEEIVLIFYDGMEGQEDHVKDGNTYKGYQFDYETDGDTLTIYTGAVQTTYTITYGEQDGTDTMQLTAEDGTVYFYTLRTRTTPGIIT